MMNNDPDWDPKLFAGKRAPVLRPLGLQVRERRAPGRRRCHHHPHHAVGRLSLAGGADFLGRRAVRAARRQRAARRPAGLDDRGGRAAAAQGRRPGPRQARRPRRARATSSPCRSASRTSLTFTNTLSRVKTANVVGVLPGSDPKLAPQVVIYSAHHDHFGIGEPDKSGDKIYNGAVDNASGCAAGAGDRARLRAAAAAAAALGDGAVRGRRGAGAARLGVLRAAPVVPGRPHRREHQHRRRQHLRTHARGGAGRPGQVLAR